MERKLIIYPGRLSEGQVEPISEKLDASFIKSEEAQFKEEVIIKGEAYLAGNVLILHLSLEAKAALLCRVCGEEVELPIEIPDFYSAEEGVTSGIFDLLPLIRESLLLELPSFVECHGGHCPHRPEMVKYLDHHSKDGYHPFKDL